MQYASLLSQEHQRSEVSSVQQFPKFQHLLGFHTTKPNNIEAIKIGIKKLYGLHQIVNAYNIMYKIIHTYAHIYMYVHILFIQACTEFSPGTV